MKFSMKKTVFAASLGLAFGAAVPVANAGLTLTFVNGTAATAIAGNCSAIAWTAEAEFRMCNTTNIALGGGFPLHKDTIIGGETFSFDDTNVMTAVTGTPGNPGAASHPGSAAPTAGTNDSWQQPAGFFGSDFNFLAPVSGSLAGTAYSTARYIGGTPTNGTQVPFIKAPVLEAQWAGTWFPLGQASGGITFYANITNAVTVGNTTTFDFEMFANEVIDVSEDPGSAGFAGWTAQWHMQGSGVYTVPANPSVANTSPAHAATGVGTNIIKYQVAFSRPMDTSTVVFGSISIGGVTVGPPTASNNDTIFSFPITSGALTGSTTYTVTFNSGPEDVAGNDITLPADKTFITAAGADNTAPTISTQSPSDGATGVSVSTTIAVTFSEPMLLTAANSITVVKTSDSSSVSGTVATTDNTTFTFTPSSPLTNDTQYTVTVAAATALDSSGINALAADATWSFTTVALTTSTLVPLKTDPLGSGCAINPRAKFDPTLLAMLLGSFGWLAWRRRRNH
ncbi:MAG: Ig-like domain-containing protein [Sulfuricaulis sp.]|uniref:Ig-like domain-containing protein n=1 Tax=Sulfuricaulis sp. TaxID=2003553 RepID=UPI0025F6FEF4|nr:Ig-like domain-containing protein [Sulfuricaulis sp.]MCR4347293.1 Ig-like domain-containing protein [Sulfuricaulis sp.]